MKRIFIILFTLSLLVIDITEGAGGLSLQLKRTNPGIAGEKSATLIFELVNTDMEHKLQGFIWCMSPDDARVSSSYGASTGSGAQYVSPLFYMDKGPYQSSMTLTIDAGSVGDKNPGCYIKYILFTEKLNLNTNSAIKVYQKISGEEMTSVTDMDYREMRLAKTVPFVAKMSNPQCPEGKTECKANEVIETNQIAETPTTKEQNTQTIPNRLAQEKTQGERATLEQQPQKRTPTPLIIGVLAVIGGAFVIYIIFSFSKKATHTFKKPKKHCSKCGTQLTAEDEFCPDCGKRL